MLPRSPAQGGDETDACYGRQKTALEKHAEYPNWARRAPWARAPVCVLLAMWALGQLVCMLYQHSRVQICLETFERFNYLLERTAEGPRRWEFFFIKSWNGVGWKGTFKGRLVQPTCSKQGHVQTDRFVQRPVQPSLECFEGWGIYKPSEQSVPTF